MFQKNRLYRWCLMFQKNRLYRWCLKSRSYPKFLPFRSSHSYR
jgi:hypothetical protein